MQNFTITNIIVFIFLFITGNACAQIETPSLGFSQACASPIFNTYGVSFSFTGSELGGSNQFIVELSDETGDFSNPTVLHTTAVGAITTSPAIINVSMPTTIAGEAFRIRIKGTDPVATSVPSMAFPAYYKIQDEPFSINNLVSTGVYCSGGSYLLTIDNPGTGDNDSPLQYPSLTFNWFRATGPTTEVFVASGPTLEVSDPGIYFVAINYGPCTSVNTNTSNKVTISEASSGGSSTISSSLGNPYCASQGLTTLSTVSANSYQWFKDGNEITGATDQTYITDESGTYAVNITLNGCSTSASIDLDANQFTSSIDVSEAPAENLMPPEGTLIVTLTDTANTPEYEWYLNDVLIAGANSASYEATEIGNYKAVISQTVGCISSKEFLFTIGETFPNVENIPNLISPNGDGTNDTWVIPQAYVSGTNAEVIIISSQGEIVLQTNDYLNNWPQEELNFKDVNPVYYYIITTQDNKTRKGSITVVK
ncbi:gliding motility-associated C-terminal domain-containing protein [Flavivirga aquimarina]|uniref:Gliding motility-associated C-terminal domain-containing protein n=1 Tax=Flavivirga aquimarina TaxID=2027862 RepID=A0ABT8W7D9_9FLAO|nr:gliding motility-associated C-terminal domain-containing protein [Flavivirga aquimarina]MDO5969034.1 gliding motility-associated C-terminal domain-containing protein [Flavivirga aquimarina]